MMFRFLTSARFQLLGAFFFATFLPAFVRGGFTIAGLSSGNNIEIIISSIIAIILGFFFYRRLMVFPGVSGDFYIILSFTTSYAIVVALFFFTRLDYTRTTLLISFLAACSWMYVINVISRLLKPPSLAIVPGGAVQGLTDISGVEWVLLKTPQAEVHDHTGVVADLRANLPYEWVRFIANTALNGIPVYHVKQVRETLTGRVEIEHLAENTLGSLIPNRVYLEIKQTFDWVGALVTLVLLSPLLVAIAILIRLDSPGPALFKQERRGYLGSKFTIYKFRTMFIDTSPDRQSRSSDNDGSLSSEREQAITKHADRRVTRVGRLLRRSRLDELPQIINILRGEMSWIGPRPEALALSDWYEAELPFYSYRHIVRPGITGWAQVHQGHVAMVGEVHKKLYYDFYYIKNFSSWVDFVIVLMTIRTVVSGFGSK